MLARPQILTFLAALSFAACESQTEQQTSLIIPSADGTIAFLDEAGKEIHLKARVVWDLACTQRFQIIADSTDPRFAGLPFLEFQAEVGTANRTFTTRRHSGDSIRVWQSSVGRMYVTSIDEQRKTVTGDVHVLFPGAVPTQAINYTWGSFTNLPFEDSPFFDSSMQFRHGYEQWVSHLSNMTVFEDSVTLRAAACGSPSVGWVRITIAHPDTGVFEPDVFTHVSFTGVPSAVPGQPSLLEPFSTIFTKKDAGRITITKLDLSKKMIEGTFSIVATSATGNKIVLKEGVLRYGTR